METNNQNLPPINQKSAEQVQPVTNIKNWKILGKVGCLLLPFAFFFSGLESAFAFPWIKELNVFADALGPFAAYPILLILAFWVIFLFLFLFSPYYYVSWKKGGNNIFIRKWAKISSVTIPTYIIVITYENIFNISYFDGFLISFVTGLFVVFALFLAPLYTFAWREKKISVIGENIPKKSFQRIFFYIIFSSMLVISLAIIFDVSKKLTWKLYSSDYEGDSLMTKGKYEDPLMCKNLKFQENKDMCFYGVAKKQNNPSFCAESGRYQDDCYLNFAEKKKDPSFCRSVNFDLKKEECCLGANGYNQFSDFAELGADQKVNCGF